MQSWDDLDGKWEKELQEGPDPALKPDEFPNSFVGRLLDQLPGLPGSLISAKGVLFWFVSGVGCVVLGGLELDGGDRFRGPQQTVGAASDVITVGLVLIGVGILTGTLRLILRNRPEREGRLGAGEPHIGFSEDQTGRFD